MQEFSAFSDDLILWLEGLLDVVIPTLAFPVAGISGAMGHLLLRTVQCVKNMSSYVHDNIAHLKNMFYMFKKQSLKIVLVDVWTEGFDPHIMLCCGVWFCVCSPWTLGFIMSFFDLVRSPNVGS